MVRRSLDRLRRWRRCQLGDLMALRARSTGETWQCLLLRAARSRSLHTYIHTYIHTYVHTYIHTYIHAYMHTCIHARIHTYIHTYIHFYRNRRVPCFLASSCKSFGGRLRAHRLMTVGVGLSALWEEAYTSPFQSTVSGFYSVSGPVLLV